MIRMVRTPRDPRAFRYRYYDEDLDRSSSEPSPDLNAAIVQYTSMVSALAFLGLVLIQFGWLALVFALVATTSLGVMMVAMHARLLLHLDQQADQPPGESPS